MACKIQNASLASNLAPFLEPYRWKMIAKGGGGRLMTFTTILIPTLTYFINFQNDLKLNTPTYIQSITPR